MEAQEQRATVAARQGPGEVSATPQQGAASASWSDAVAYTRGKSPASFDQWFSGVEFESLTDGVLGLRARDEFVRQWVDDHFMPTLAERLREGSGLAIEVRWSVGGELIRPVAPSDSSFAPVEPRAPVHAPSTPEVASAGPADEFPRPSHSLRIVTSPAVEGLNPRYTFANFVVGPSNQLAHAASLAAAGVGARRHNPVFVCGGTGLGKTHLVHAIAHRVHQERPSATIAYISAERFVNEFVQALTDQRMHEFRARYREKCDVLLVDDIHFLAGKTQTQEEFFHAFNALHQASRQIVVTSDKYPQQLDKMEERLVSRFQVGASSPTFRHPSSRPASRSSERRPRSNESSSPMTFAFYIAQSVRSNVRELEGTLIRLAAKASLLGRADRHRIRPRRDCRDGRVARPSEAGVEDIQRVVCHHFKLRSTDLLSQGPPQERRVRAARRDVPLQATAEVQLSRARAGLRQPRPHDRHQRGAKGRGAAIHGLRSARAPRGDRAKARRRGVERVSSGLKPFRSTRS